MKKVYSLVVYYQDYERGTQMNNCGLYSSKKKAKKAKKKAEADDDLHYPGWRNNGEYMIHEEEVH